jgi:spermidine synthase
MKQWVSILASYIFPIRLKKRISTISGTLEINLVNGQRILDTEVSNYSYGALQRILRKGLFEMGMDDPNIRMILLLGLGGGSVIQTLREEFSCTAHITAVDIDPKVIAIAKDEFRIDRFADISIIEADAADYVFNAPELFDLIIVDVFIGNTIPTDFKTAKFIHSVCNKMKQGGKLLYNIMNLTMNLGEVRAIQEAFNENGMRTRIVENVESTNTLLLVEKVY